MRDYVWEERKVILSKSIAEICIYCVARKQGDINVCLLLMK